MSPNPPEVEVQAAPVSTGSPARRHSRTPSVARRACNARTDLVSPERTEELARAQYRSLQRLAKLDDDVAVWPTHGAGSFCSAPPGADRTSRIGAERATNSLLRAESEDAFVKQLLDSLGTFPPYFLRLGEVNRRGPALVEGVVLTPLTPAVVARLTASGAQTPHERLHLRAVTFDGLAISRHSPTTVTSPTMGAHSAHSAHFDSASK